MPCTAREAISMSMLPDMAQTAEAAVNSARPTANTRRRPSRSASAPAVSTALARASV